MKAPKRKGAAPDKGATPTTPTPRVEVQAIRSVAEVEAERVATIRALRQLAETVAFTIRQVATDKRPGELTELVAMTASTLAVRVVGWHRVVPEIGAVAGLWFPPGSPLAPFEDEDGAP